MNDVGIPHLLHVFSTFVPAGPEMRTVRMINALGTEFRHSILAMDGRTDARDQLDSGAPATVLESLPRAGTPKTVRALRGLVREQRPDLVLSYNWGAFDSVFATCSLGLGRRHIHHEDGFNLDEAQQFKGRRVWTRRLLLPRLARVVVPSNVLAGVADKLWKLSAKKLDLIPNGIDLDQFSIEAQGAKHRAALGIEQDAVVVGYVGHLRPVKNPLRLLQAFASVPVEAGTLAPQLLVLGEGEEREGMLATAKQLGIEARVHLVGHQADTASWYQAMDLFAISSDSEQMPVALLEAMASSLAVVSTDVGDVRSMMPDAQGEFVAGNSPKKS